MTDDIVEESARKLANPMLGVGEDRFQITLVVEAVAEVALKVDRPAAEVAIGDHPTHRDRFGSELKVVTGGHEAVMSAGELRERHCFGGVDRERLLDINVATGAEAN